MKQAQSLNYVKSDSKEECDRIASGFQRSMHMLLFQNFSLLSYCLFYCILSGVSVTKDGVWIVHWIY
jgi:hypothetical protein